jgi:hypothetical protein
MHQIVKWTEHVQDRPKWKVSQNSPRVVVHNKKNNSMHYIKCGVNSSLLT